MGLICYGVRIIPISINRNGHCFSLGTGNVYSHIPGTRFRAVHGEFGWGTHAYTRFNTGPIYFNLQINQSKVSDAREAANAYCVDESGKLFVILKTKNIDRLETKFALVL